MPLLPRFSLAPPALTVALLLLAPGEIHAHGGVYRPPYRPGDTVPYQPRPGSSTGPRAPRSPVSGRRLGGPARPYSNPTTGSPYSPAGTPGPLTPGSPSSGSRDDLEAMISWRPWWRFHRDELIDVRRILYRRSPETGGIESRRAALRRKLAERLSEILYGGGSVAVSAPAMIAYGRIADARHMPIGIDAEVRHHALRQWPGKRMELAEAACLAVAIANAPEAQDDLMGLLGDDVLGQRLRQGTEWPARSLGFAAYGLGLLGRSSTDQRDRRDTVHALMTALAKPSGTNDELRVACLFALALVPIDACKTTEEMVDPRRQMKDSGNHLCGQAQADFVLEILRDTEYEDLTRSYAAVTLGSLADDARFAFPGSEDHPPVKSREQLSQEMVRLLRQHKTSPQVRRGLVIGLGACLRARRSAEDDEAVALLLERTKKGGPFERRYATIAIGRALARTPSTRRDGAWYRTLEAMEKALLRGRKGVRGWNALALAFTGRSGPTKDRERIRRTLEAALEKKNGNSEDNAAIALALAVVAPDSELFEQLMLFRYQKDRDEVWRGVARVVLGLIGSERSLAALQAEAKAEDLNELSVPRLVSLLAGLRLAGDRNVGAHFQDRLQAALAKLGQPTDKKPPTDPKEHAKYKSHRAAAEAEIGSLLRAAAELDLLEAAPSLLAILDAPDMPDSVLAATIQALGTLADDDATDWAAPYAHLFDYSAPTWALLSPFGDNTGLLDHR